MSATVKDISSLPRQADHDHESKKAISDAPKGGNWKGFVAGVCSGVAKLSIGYDHLLPSQRMQITKIQSRHPFDTVKVRLQTSSKTQFKGPLDCLLQTLRKEGVNGLYKGATPPLVGWMCMDSLMLGSLTVYRRLLNEHIFQPYRVRADRAQPSGQPVYLSDEDRKRLPAFGHGLAGILAGWTVSFIAAPVEHVKARLQIQYQVSKSQRLYTGPIDCTQKIFRNHGIPGLWHGLSATLLFRSFFFCWWGTYDIFTRELEKRTSLSTPAVNFWAGGLSAQVFWITSYPSDVIKQRIMTDSLGADRKYPRWKDAAKSIYADAGLKGYWRGFLPCFLRAFPANAMALVAFEGVMRSLNRT